MNDNTARVTDADPSTRTQSIRRQVVFESVDLVHDITGNPLRVPVTLRSAPADPRTVTLAFSRNDVRTIPRDLLIDGVDGTAELGDVRVGVCQIGWVGITFRSPGGNSKFRMRRRTLTSFLADTAHHIDLCGEIDRWLRETAG